MLHDIQAKTFEAVQAKTKTSVIAAAKKAISKNDILSLVWQYSTEADTHTVETHIYRLRKKILKKFNDKKFIKSTPDGYQVN